MISSLSSLGWSESRERQVVGVFGRRLDGGSNGGGSFLSHVKRVRNSKNSTFREAELLD